jgi:hypothetical protein
MLLYPVEVRGKFCCILFQDFPFLQKKKKFHVVLKYLQEFAQISLRLLGHFLNRTLNLNFIELI